MRCASRTAAHGGGWGAGRADETRNIDLRLAVEAPPTHRRRFFVARERRELYSSLLLPAYTHTHRIISCVRLGKIFTLLITLYHFLRVEHNKSDAKTARFQEIPHKK